MLVIKDLYSDISDCFWLFYGSKYKNSLKRGYLGLMCAMVVALVNGYSYGFLSGKACVITIAYFAIIVAGYHFKRAQRLEQLIRR